MEIDQDIFVGLMVKNVNGTISRAEEQQLQPYLDHNPIAAQIYQALNDFDSWWDTFWCVHDTDIEAAWSNIQ